MTGRSPKERLCALALPLGDGMGFAIALLVGIGLMSLLRRERMNGDLSYWWSTTGEPQALLFLAFAGFSLARLASKGHYTARLPFWDELLSIWQVLLLSIVLFGTTFVAARWTVSRFLWPVSWGLASILLPLGRSVVRRTLDRVGLWRRSTAVVGPADRAREVARALEEDRGLGYRVDAILTLEPTEGGTEGGEFPVVIPLSADGILPRLQALGFPDVVVLLDSGSPPEWIEQLTLYPSGIRVIPALGGLPLLGMEASLVFRHDMLLLRIRNRLERGSGAWLKRGFDFVGAAAGIILLSPLFLWIRWMLLRREGKGPVLFGHGRIGRGGRIFSCWKFRTMVRDSDAALRSLLENDPAARAEWERDFKLKHDPRVTPFGAFLRRTSLDELPQLWNVLKGEMSLVGPRPIVPAELEKYGVRADFYRSVRPGLTGLWQVSGRSDLTYPERVALDTWYVKNWRFWYDVAILVQTVRAVATSMGAR